MTSAFAAHTSSELNEDEDGHKAVMIGAVIGSRTIQTKKGETMGFIQLEDVQGTYECVAFPRTWKQTQDLWQKDKIVLVRGTIDGKGKVAKILLDSATDKPQVTSAVPDKKGSGISKQGSGIGNQKANGNGNGKPVAANGRQQPNVVKEQLTSYQAEPAKPVNQQTVSHAATTKVNGQPPHGGASQPAANDQRPTTPRPLPVNDHFEIRDDLFLDEDPFAGEAFIPDMDDPIAVVTPVEDFGVPQHDNPLAESTADYAERGRTTEPIAVVVKREFTASVPPQPIVAPPPVQAEPAPKKNGNGNGHGDRTSPASPPGKASPTSTASASCVSSSRPTLALDTHRRSGPRQSAVGRH